MQCPGWNSTEGLDKHKRRWALRLPLLVLPGHVPCLGSAPCAEHPCASLGTGSSHCQAPAPSTATCYFFLKKINFLGFFAVSVLEHGQERLVINYGGLSPLRRGKENPGSLRKGNTAAPWLGGEEPREVGIPPKPSPDPGKSSWGSLAGQGAATFHNPTPTPPAAPEPCEGNEKFSKGSWREVRDHGIL